jgi:hypothetical protein
MYLFLRLLLLATSILLALHAISTSAENDAIEYDELIKLEDPTTWADVVAGKIKPLAGDDEPQAAAVPGKTHLGRSISAATLLRRTLDSIEGIDTLHPRSAAAEAIAIADANADPDGFRELTRREEEAMNAIARRDPAVLFGRDDNQCGTYRSFTSPYRNNCHTNLCRRYSDCRWRGHRCGGRRMRGQGSVIACLGCSCRAH